ncbi:ATP-dependent DNA ligase [Yimella sp. NH-Cas1]|uniref:ATP-dependent DNA ligase n=1 Tax=Yimella sp. NH-Cas1 TaxID=2917726 RepID=UPI001EFA4DC5|nr:ATP-dependent DNA ligase [Yimella sp. NH-Cas1]MCG8655394.1 ATP-dependent DNA ligase [Yimella sp. NH-Cas1]
MAKSEQTAIEVGGHEIKVTNLDKVMYPETGTTKSDVIDYYRQVAPWFVAHASRRPATRKRWVDGVGTADEPRDAFFHKNLDPASTPDWVATVSLEHRHRASTYPLVDDEATLVWLAQLASLEIHVPQWKVGPRGGHQNPDRMILDLDPGEGAGIAKCIEVAHLCKELLDGMKLTSVPVTSGSKGIHLYAGLDGKHTAAQVTEVAKALAEALEKEHPDLVVSNMRKDVRGGRVLIDWSENNGNKTAVAPYSLRGRDHPYVAVPREWNELTASLEQLTPTQVLQRLASIGDPMQVLLDKDERVSRTAKDRLTKYRSMRDQAKTPEPVPEASPVAGEGHSFVIQEHHASRLHYDFRLERDGVLVSWAVPKGPPDDPKENHLAVMTEDHPLEYGSFEGTIPQGQYGGGEVKIWDAGTYECEKWRDDKEVIAVLHGRPDGGLGGEPVKFAIIHTKMGGDDKNWLMHRMELEPADSQAATGTSDSTTDQKLPRFEAMLASVGSVDDLGSRDWVFETKWDGYRAIAEVTGGQASLRSRNGKDFTRTYPELAELGSLLDGHTAVLDGEIVALDEDGRSNFGSLQNHGAGGSKAHYMVFDLLYLDGESLLRTPYSERRKALEALTLDGEYIHLPVTLGSDAEAALKVSKDLKLEGMIAKTIDGVYQQGKRAGTWLKIKNQRMQEVIVVGWKPGAGSRANTIGSLLLAVNGDDGLTYVGRVGTGFNAKQLAEIKKRLERLERKTPALDDVPRADAKDAKWVRPSEVGEVTFGEWTVTDRLRHPAWRGWRPDKNPQDVVREDG